MRPWAAAPNTLPKRAIGTSRSDNLAWPRDTPSSAVERLSITPRSGRIGGERAQKRLGLEQLLGGGLDIFQGQKQHAVVIEEGAAVGPADVRKEVFVLGQAGGERGRAGFRQFPASCRRSPPG